MADDLATRLAAALDPAEAEARTGGSDITPDFLLRLVERDRALAALYRDVIAVPASADAVALVTRQVDRAVAFWEEVPSGT